MVAISQVSRLMDELQTPLAASYPHVWCDGETLVVGIWPNAKAKFDFASERLKFVDNTEPNAKKHISFTYLAKRLTGSIFEIETSDTIYEFASAVQALLRGLEILETIAPGTLDKMCELKGRSKRPVGHTRESLYDLASQRHFAEQINTGHFVATNNKALEALGVLRQGARLAGLSTDQFTVRRR